MRLLSFLYYIFFKVRKARNIYGWPKKKIFLRNLEKHLIFLALSDSIINCIIVLGGSMPFWTKINERMACMESNKAYKVVNCGKKAQRRDYSKVSGKSKPIHLNGSPKKAFRRFSMRFIQLKTTERILD